MIGEKIGIAGYEGTVNCISEIVSDRKLKPVKVFDEIKGKNVKALIIGNGVKTEITELVELHPDADVYILSDITLLPEEKKNYENMGVNFIDTSFEHIDRIISKYSSN